MGNSRCVALSERRDDGFTPQPEKAIAGVRSVGGQDFLVAKLSSRKNLTIGVILKRPLLLRLGTRQGSPYMPGALHLASHQGQGSSGQDAVQLG